MILSDVQKRLKGHASAHYDGLRAHHYPPTLNPGLTCAAVLVPLIQRSTGLTLVFTERSATLPHHAGQISFPGGKRDAQDQDAAATALREAYEEIGVDPRHVTLLGSLAPYETQTGFYVVPIIGSLPENSQFVLNAHEVADVFEVPLSHILNQVHHNKKDHPHTHRIVYENKVIWGMTAQLVAALADRLL